MEETDFGWALRIVKRGGRFAREGWNGKGMYVAMQVPDANSKMGRPYLYIKSVDGLLVPWAPSQTDILANDYSEVTAE